MRFLQFLFRCTTTIGPTGSPHLKHAGYRRRFRQYIIFPLVVLLVSFERTSGSMLWIKSAWNQIALFIIWNGNVRIISRATVKKLREINRLKTFGKFNRGIDGSGRKALPWRHALPWRRWFRRYPGDISNDRSITMVNNSTETKETLSGYLRISKLYNVINMDWFPESMGLWHVSTRSEREKNTTVHETTS